VRVDSSVRLADRTLRNRWMVLVMVIKSQNDFSLFLGGAAEMFSYKLTIIVAVPYVPSIHGPGAHRWPSPSHLSLRPVSGRTLSSMLAGRRSAIHLPRHQEREIHHCQGNVDDGFCAWRPKYVGIHQAP
jgi:hypothetical protein